MFGIELKKKDNIKNREKQIEEPLNDKNKYYIEINPKTEIVRVENKEQLKVLNELEEPKALDELKKIKSLPDQLPPLRGQQVCGHWEREIIFLSQSNPKLWKETKNEMITGGYCPDCGADLGQPKPEWYPRAYYKRK